MSVIAVITVSTSPERISDSSLGSPEPTPRFFFGTSGHDAMSGPVQSAGAFLAPRHGLYTQLPYGSRHAAYELA